MPSAAAAHRHRTHASTRTRRQWDQHPHTPTAAPRTLNFSLLDTPSNSALHCASSASSLGMNIMPTLQGGGAAGRGREQGHP